MAYLADAKVASLRQPKATWAPISSPWKRPAITIEKGFVGRKPLMRARITRGGRQLFGAIF